jgi:hypothetical protein
MFKNLTNERVNSEIFRDKVHNFDNLCRYTQKILDGQIPYECYENGNIATDKVCLHSPISSTFYYLSLGSTFYITEIGDGLGYEVLFWEKVTDRFNYFSSAGRLSRLVRKLFNQSSRKSENVRFDESRLDQINKKINKL